MYVHRDKKAIYKRFNASRFRSIICLCQKTNDWSNGWMETHQDIKESKLVLDWMMHSKEVFAIAAKETNQLIGTIGLHVRKKNMNAFI